MSLPPVLEMSKDSSRLGGAGRSSIFVKSSRVWATRSSAVVARSASSAAFRWAMDIKDAFSPRWGTWTQTLCPARLVSTSERLSQYSSVSKGRRISWGRMALGR